MNDDMQAIADFCQQAVADDRCSGAFGKEVEQRLVDQQAEIERLRSAADGLCVSCQTDRDGGPMPAILCRDCAAKSVSGLRAEINDLRAENAHEFNLSTEWGHAVDEWQERTGYSNPAACQAEIERLRESRSLPVLGTVSEDGTIHCKGELDG